VPSCAILLWMSRRSCSVTQNSMRIGLVRSAIGYSPPSNYNGHFKRETWYPLRKKSLSLYNGQFFVNWGGSPKKTFQFTTDIFSEKNRGLPEKSENKNAPGF